MVYLLVISYSILDSRYIQFSLRDKPGEYTIAFLRLPLTVKLEQTFVHTVLVQQ